MSTQNRRREGIIALGALVLGGALAFLAAPSGSRLDAAASGDDDLAERVRQMAQTARGLQSLSVAEITQDSTTFAGVGSMAPKSGEPPEPTTPFELGSITKTFTGLALAQAVRNGTVSLKDFLDTHLPELEGSEAGGVTLGDLAAHRSGMPSLIPPQVMRLLLQWTFGAGNVSGYSDEQLLEDAKTVKLVAPGTYAYSNFGATLAGWALARAEGTEWIDLINRQVLVPIGMNQTVFVVSPTEIPAMPGGFKANGRPAPHSCCNAEIPSGSGTMASAADIAAYVQALLSEDPAAQLAMTPREDADASRIGLFWHITEIDGRQITWHSGATAAFRTALVIDRDAGRAVLVMGNTDRDVDDIAFGLLTDEEAQALAPPTVALVIFGVFVLNAVAWLVHFWRSVARKPVAGPALWLSALALLTRAVGPWQLLPGAAWAGACGISAAAVAVGIRQSCRRPSPQKTPLPRKRVVNFNAAIAALSIGIGSVLNAPWGTRTSLRNPSCRFRARRV